MKLFDINILIYAHRADQPFHKTYRERLEMEIESSEPFGISSLAAAGFIRIVTQSRFPGGPTPMSQALSVIESMIEQPNAVMVNPGTGHWEIISDLCRRTGAMGKFVADIQHAAVAIEHSCTWITRDTDFDRLTKHGLRLEIWSPGVSDQL